jgi:integrase
MASIRQRPNGKWRARYRDDAGKEHARHFDRKRDAQDWLDSTASAIITGTYVAPSRSTTTLANYYADWSPRQLWEPTTKVAMDLAVAKCTFLDVPFGRLRRSHVEAWVKAMSVDLKPSTVHTRVNNVRAALRAAVRDRYLAEDPAEGVVLPRRRRADQAMRLPTPDEVHAVIEAAEPWFQSYVRLAAFAGLRLGEASGVQVDDVAWLERTLKVRRQVQRGAGGQAVRISPPKYGSERSVPIPDELTQYLSRHISEVGVRGNEGWLFVGSGGLPPHGNTIYYHWTKTIDAADVEPFKLHDLRHFFASGLIAAGCDVVTVQRALGHRSASVTLNTYSHLWPNADDRTRTASAGLMRQVSGDPADSLRTEAAE